MPTHKTAILVPAYNAAGTIPEFLCRVSKTNLPAEVVFVDDGSTDNSQALVVAAGQVCLSHTSNRGKGAALRTGFRYARTNGYRSVVTLDADLQHPPELVPEFLAQDNGSTLVLGRRRLGVRQMPPARCLSNFLTSLVVSIMAGYLVHDSQCGFRLYPTTLLDRLKLTSTHYDLESELLLKAVRVGVTIAEVPIPAVYGQQTSHISHAVDTLRFMKQLAARVFG